jgi:MraZ protein
MFRGITDINLDNKGRIALPKRQRDILLSYVEGEGRPQVVLTIDTESPCLLLYPAEEWQTIEAKLQRLPSFNPTARGIQRLLIGHATDLEIDGQGRLLIPNVLREYAQLQKKIMLVGQGKKLEIWDADTWNQLRQQWLEETAQADSLPEELQDLAL